MRVLIVVPWDQEVGGVASVVGNLAVELARAGHGSVFLHPGAADKPVPGRTKWGFPSYRVRLRGPSGHDRPIRSVLAFWTLLLPSLARIAGLLRRERIDIVNLHYPIESFLSVVLAARILGRPVVTSVHGADLFPHGDPRVHYSLGIRSVLRLSRRIVSPSRAYLGQLLEQFPTLKDRAEFIHNGVRLEEFSMPAPDQEGNSPREAARSALDIEHPLACVEGRYVLTIAAHKPQKGLDVLLLAFGRLADRFPDVTLVLVGDGPLRVELKELVLRLGLGERVRFLGVKSRPDTIALLHGCDIFVLPSRAEPFGLVVVEAMACAKPVVATRVGGIREIVRSGVDGLLVEPDNPNALVGAIASLLADPDFSRRLGDEAFRRARCFGTEPNARLYESLFRDLIAEG